MTVKEIVRLSAVYLNKENVVKYLDGGADNDALSTVNTLTICANVIINEIASSYINMVTREQVSVTRNKVEFSSLNNTPFEIVGVYDSLGDKLPFTIGVDCINVSSSARYVEYKYLPANYGLTDTIGFENHQVPLRLLAYGVVAEYLLCERAFDDSIVWRNRYNDTLAILVPPESKTIKSRAFV